MKLFLALFTTLFVLILFMSPADAKTHKADPGYTYEIELGDVGKIKATAKTKQKAFKSAATECFDRRVAKFEKFRGKVTENRALDFIDSCANIPY